MATKKTPTRRVTGRPSAGRARTTTAKAAARKTVAKPRAAKPAARRAAAKKPATSRSNVAVISKRPTKQIAPGRIARRCVFVDVENTSSEEDLFEVLDALQLDRATQPTEVTAVGNWRAISQRLGRRLAGIGAQLVHSAPATGVKDWSDLWIAVAAGCWLGRAEPGDVLEIVSNDRAFDAVGDAAAARGVTYRRLLHKRGASATAAAAAEEEEPKRRRRSRGGRRRRGRGTGSASSTAAAAPAHAPAAHVPAAHHPPAAARTAHPKPAHRAPSHPPLHDMEAHGATRDQIVSVIGRLAGSEPTRWINLDVLEKALKAEGFARPPGSPRLVTRLRMLKDVEVDSHGRARLAAAPAPEPDAADAEEAAPAKAAPKKRRRRRKPSASGEASESASVEAAPFAAAAYSEPPAE